VELATKQRISTASNNSTGAFREGSLCRTKGIECYGMHSEGSCALMSRSKAKVELGTFKVIVRAELVKSN